MASDVTKLLIQARDGDASALDRLLPIVYDELLAMAHRQRARWGPTDTLNTTALVHEVYERLAGGRALSFTDRVHFFRVAGRAMRGVLVDYARAQNAQKRGGPERPLSIDGTMIPLAAQDLRIDEILSINDALARLEAIDARQARVVECRYFAGMSVEETAEALDISKATVKRDWTMARAWLYQVITS